MSNQHARILAVDDNTDALFALEQLLLENGYEVITASSGEEAWHALSQQAPDLALLDVVMPGPDGYELVRRAKADTKLQYIPLVLLTGKSELEDIIFGLDQGADDYIVKPFQSTELLARVNASLRKAGLYKQLKKSHDENRNLRDQVVKRYSFSNIIGQSAKMHQVFDLIEKVAESTAPILITGDSGTGKELVARSIHYNSGRRDQAFVAQNCSAFVETLLESELFGSIKGAFTGANRDKPGLFESADGGTFFLDELGEMSQALQVKLLRVLQDGTFTPVGATKPKQVDVRIVAATNRDLDQMVKDGSFREDLFYRISVINIALPPLRERREDIPLLIEHFLQESSSRSKKPVKRLSPEALKLLVDFNWPGNIRQLQNEIERIVLLSEGDVIDPQIVSNYISKFNQTSDPALSNSSTYESLSQSNQNLKEAMESLERSMILKTLDRCNGNKSEAARELGISRSSLIAKVQSYQS